MSYRGWAVRCITDPFHVGLWQAVRMVWISCSSAAVCAFPSVRWSALVSSPDFLGDDCGCILLAVDGQLLLVLLVDRQVLLLIPSARAVGTGRRRGAPWARRRTAAACRPRSVAARSSAEVTATRFHSLVTTAVVVTVSAGEQWRGRRQRSHGRLL